MVTRTRRHTGRGRRWAGLLTAVLLMTMPAFVVMTIHVPVAHAVVPKPARGVVRAPLTPLVAALQRPARAAGLGRLLTGLTAADWRIRLRPLLAAMPAMHAAVSVAGPVRGAVLAGTLRLPTSLVLSGDTTIIAQRIVLTSRTLRVYGHHALHLYPVTSLSAPPSPHRVLALRRSQAHARAVTSTAQFSGSPITIDNTGSPGSTGTDGDAGLAGFTGSDGSPGQDALTDLGSCIGQATGGGPGDDGGAGDVGGLGGDGGIGGDGSDISLDIPDGSTDSYVLITNGGSGGPGGTGGVGGDGGNGGNGGDGGAGDSTTSCQPAGGGNGGNGGDGGDGGVGGNGGDGGNAGNITVTYPQGYNAADIQAKADGGDGGAGGEGGAGGGAGFGGFGGFGGADWSGFTPGGPAGADGADGLSGVAGSFGASGGQGMAGSIDLIQRDPSNVCDGMQNEPEVHDALQQLYSNLTRTDPFPAEEPPPSALPPCPPPTTPARVGARDVAFGDSYMSGEGAPVFDSNPVTAPGGAGCHDALTAWAALIYNVPLPTTDNQVSFQNWACTGATIAGVQGQLSRAIATAANPGTTGPQGLGSGTMSVQVSVGGNNLGFAADLTCAVENGATASNNTRTRDRNGNLCIPDDGPMTTAANAIQGQLAALYGQIADAAPNAIVEVAGYPVIFSNDRKCRTGMTRADEIQTNRDFNIVDNMIAGAVAQAQGAGAAVRYLAFNSALANANACPTGNGNTHGVNVPFNNESASGTMGYFHPNRAGHQALADAYARLAAAGFTISTQSAPALTNGTLVSDESSDSVYVAAGGALFGFANLADLTAAGYPANFTTLALTPSQIASLPGQAADGTLLKDASTGAVFAVSGGALVPQPSQSAASAVTVPGQTLDGYPIAEGSFVTIAGGDGTIYEVVGGAPVVVTDMSHAGGARPVAAISQARFSGMPQTPADGTFVSATVPGTSTVNNYEFAGGAPIFVSDWSHVGGQPSTPPIAIDQTAIDNAGGSGAFSHIRQTPADGTFVTATVPGTSTVNAYVFAGGAPVYISDWSHVGGKPAGPIAAIDQTAIDNAGTGGVYSHILPVPPDGTYLTGQGAGGSAVASYVVAGGAPIPVTDWTHLGGPNATTPPAGINPVPVDETALDNAGSGGVYNHLRAVPADGTILAGNADKTNAIFVVAGGAPIYVSNWEDIGGARGSDNVDQTAIDEAGAGGIFNHMRAKPADGTLVESFGSGHIFVIAGGAPLQVSSLANIGSPTQTPTFVDQVALDKAGTGGFYNHLNFTPPDNTLLAGNGTNMFVVAGGAPLYVPNMSDIGGARPSVTVDQAAIDNAGTGGDWNHLNFTPASNTLLAGNGTNMFVVAGGAPIYVPYLEDIGGARGFVTVDQAAIDNAGTGGYFNHMTFQPADGTIIESFNTGSVYQVIAGVPTLDCSAAQTFLYVDQFALDGAGTGGFYNHLAPLPSPPPPPCPPPPPSGGGPQL